MLRLDQVVEISMSRRYHYMCVYVKMYRWIIDKELYHANVDK